ncbi:MAG: hypothetical protein DME89_04645 [Verrucomicrobia bacterium]|nr:MAG: hypothetical protein DME89_04645 [Verrucomicrobiota bacterium]
MSDSKRVLRGEKASGTIILRRARSQCELDRAQSSERLIYQRAKPPSPKLRRAEGQGVRSCPQLDLFALFLFR